MWSIPNAQQANYEEQAQVYDSSLNDLVIARLGTGVTSGCEVTSVSGLSLNVASGTVQFNGTTPVTVDGDTVLIDASPTTTDVKRIDIISVDMSGDVQYTAGIANVDPYEPALPASNVKLAAVFVQTSNNSIVDGMILDRRVQVVRPYSVYEYAVATGQYVGDEVDFLDSFKGADGDASDVPGVGCTVINHDEDETDVPAGVEAGEIIFIKEPPP